MHSSDKQEKSYKFPNIGFGQIDNANQSLFHSLEKPSTNFDSEMDTVREQAYEIGLSKGKNESTEIWSLKLTPLMNALHLTTETIRRTAQKMNNYAVDDALQIGTQLASVWIKNRSLLSPELFETIFKKALTHVTRFEWMKIHIHSDHLETANIIINRDKLLGDTSKSIEIVSDTSIQRGGCLIETDFGVIDARIEQQLKTVISELLATVTNIDNNLMIGTNINAIFESCHRCIEKIKPIKSFGHVTKVVGLVVEANGPSVQLGSICDIYGNENIPPIAAEVLGFRDKSVLMMPLEEIRAIGPGSRVVTRQEKASVSVGRKMLGRIIDGLGQPIDARGPLNTDEEYPLYASPINPLLRQRIRTPLDFGIRAINGLLTVGCGQRMGIFAGSGVGKSVLMGMIARQCRADVNVIALIGERGRELNDFIEKDLGAEGLKKSVVVVATSDHLPLVRVRGAFVATAIAEYFRDQGLTVNLMMDSLTRFAMAQREIGLALGEPPTTKGYTPSVFTMLPKLLERAGTSDHTGTITGLYTVLVEGDDMNEPIADSARSILDGHIVLTRELAAQNHYPAIDIMRSISRVMEDISALKHKHNAGRLKELLATYRKAEDLINIGAYVPGSNPQIDRAIAKIDRINAYLRQGIQECIGFEESIDQLEKIMNTD